MVQVNENVKENEIEMTATTEEREGESTKVESSKNDKILHSISIDNDKEVSSTKRFVQIIGRKENSIKEKDRNGNKISENSKLNDNDDSLTVIHEFDATTDDPFTLESFDSLIQQHAEKNKDFIIARVTTVDPLDESKVYQSYYSGHNINKVLFRTQPDQSLLHRMKAKNPLNNMNIIGDVHYYVIKAASVRKVPTSVKSSSMSIASRKTLKAKEVDNVAIVATSSLDKNENDFTKTKIEDVKLRSAPPSIWNFNTGNDEEEGKVLIEMESSKRWSADDSLKPLPKALTVNHSNLDGENLEKLLTSFKSQTFINNDKVVDNSNEIDSSSSLKEQNVFLPTTTQSPTKESHFEEDNKEENVTIYYKAILYATDDDFLMRSAVRQFFKSNALDPMDAQLFTINPLHNSYAINGTPPSAQLERMVDHAYLVEVGQAQSHENLGDDVPAPTSRWRRIINSMRMNKGLRWLVLMYMIFGFLLIRFVVSETYAYLMAFLLMLCLFLVFCVGSGIGIWGR